MRLPFAHDQHRHQSLFLMVMAPLLWFALGVRLAFLIGISDSWMAGLVKYLSFYTHLTNMLAALAVTLPLFKLPGARFFQRGSIIAGIAANLVVVSLTFNLLLRHVFPLHGVQIGADFILHDLIPLLFVVYWWLFAPKGTWQWRSIALWLFYPIGFFCYSLIRGAAVGWYPYPFINVAKLGYQQTLINALGILAGMIAISAVFMLLDRFQHRRLAAAIGTDGNSSHKK
ncbi:uncharacterized protein NMK_0901 [Novimethylophilus kurashikiensis]|uniref:Pr6Pr family membrane protein n=1 Tax=Novimethylophilus kurashikiensis TaxID=1825523 RepID=A0A2R5F5B1_9PROT|nr:Pr6Pr family membrane protein [Novimethylophilus kurashikiensis]GBG13355.1 uncharacterized protein NMK_0901 [Novimethylophilus kurashikiensis]